MYRKREGEGRERMRGRGRARARGNKPHSGTWTRIIGLIKLDELARRSPELK